MCEEHVGSGKELLRTFCHVKSRDFVRIFRGIKSWQGDIFCSINLSSWHLRQVVQSSCGCCGSLGESQWDLEPPALLEGVSANEMTFGVHSSPAVGDSVALTQAQGSHSWAAEPPAVRAVGFGTEPAELCMFHPALTAFTSCTGGWWVEPEKMRREWWCPCGAELGEPRTLRALDLPPCQVLVGLINKGWTVAPHAALCSCGGNS